MTQIEELVKRLREVEAHPDKCVRDRIFDAAAALESQAARVATLEAIVAEMREALEGVIRVADRATIEFDAAKSALAALRNMEAKDDVE
jgi:hypothetical protein